MECYSKGVMTRAGSRRPAAKEKRRPVQVSPPCEVRIALQAASPFVPDGRTSLAELSLEVVFASVTFEFDPDEDPLLGRCQVAAPAGKGKFSKLVLNDVERDGERLPASFLSARPAEFAAALGVESEPMAEDEAAARSAPAPEKVRLAFWTDFSKMPVKWGSRFGTAALPDFKVVFEVPFRDLVRGKSFSATLPYQGTYPEDSGTWQVVIKPRAGKAESAPSSY